jgi:hypothetical protein
MEGDAAAKDDPTGIGERMRMGPVIVLRDSDGSWRSDETDAYNAAMLATQTDSPEQPKRETDPAPGVKALTNADDGGRSRDIAADRAINKR